ncbi:glycosyltransferase [Sphingomonas sp. CJ20]
MLTSAIDAIAREATLFAALCFLVGGLDDLLVDLVYLGRRIAGLLAQHRGSAAEHPAMHGPVPAGRIILFVPAWDESAVISRMLRAALARFAHDNYALYVGTYPNDAATIGEVARVACADARVRLVINDHPGPTTKADCLNALWRALLRDEAAEGFTTRAVVLHDAEDVVHPHEIALYARWIGHYDAVQLPVLPLPHPRSRFIAGHYCDEFAEANWALA